MKHTWKLTAVLLWVVLPAAASGVTVIANSSVKASSVTSEDLKCIFLTTKTSLANGGHVEPVLLRSGAVYQTFVKQYLGKTAATLENYYRSLVFSGKGTMPQMLASDAEVVEYVAKTRGAIGYVSSGASIERVKILEVR
jgi:ABC-type phosphate transport system substrate-binding protein